MNTILANYTTSISELKKSPTKVLNDAHGEPVAILNRNTTEAYLVPAKAFEFFIDLLDDAELARIVKQKQAEKSKAIEVNIDEL